MAEIFIDPKENIYFMCAEAKATALSGRVGGQFDIFGLQIDTGLSGELGSIGGRLGIGLRPTNDGTIMVTPFKLSLENIFVINVVKN